MATPFDIKIPISMHELLNKDSVGSLGIKFTEYVRDLYIAKILEELQDKKSRYRKRWESTSKQYAEFMESKGYPVSIVFTEELLCSFFKISYIRKYILLEIDDRSRITEGKKSVATKSYLRLIEYGTTRFHARYLFTPIRRDIEYNLKKYWDDFYEEYSSDKKNKKR